MLHLVVAHHQEPLDWLQALPVPCAVTVYSADAALDPATLGPHVAVHTVPAGTPAIGAFVHHLRRGPAAWRSELTVFTPADPLHHAPAFTELLAQHDRFGTLQALAPADPFSLTTLVPLAHHDDAALRAGRAYQRKHGLSDGTPLLAHCLSLIGLDGLADEARDAHIGHRAAGAIVAVRHEHLARAMERLAPHLDTLALLLRADRNYPEVVERAWLHLLGQPFVRLEGLALPAQPAAATVPAPAPSMARVVASIDAVLAQSTPRPAAPAPSSVAPSSPTAATAPPAATPHDIDLLRQRAQAAFLRGDSSSAWALLRQALDHAPRDIGLLADATQMAYAQQDTERALHCARRALAVDPEHVDCLFTLGMCLAATGEAEEALAIFERLNHGELAVQWQERQRDAVPPTLPHRASVAA